MSDRKVKNAMSDEEVFAELIWDKVQIGNYVICEDKVYEYESGVFICDLGCIQINS